MSTGKTPIDIHPTHLRRGPQRRWSLVLLLLAGCGQRESASAPEGAATGEPPATPARVLSAVAGPKPVPRSSAADNPAGWPAVEFEPGVMDFGLLPPGGRGEGRVRLWNASVEPLKIVTSRTSCGCTSAEDLTGRVIAPGGFTEFAVAMDMKSGLGPKKEAIRILFEGNTGTLIEYAMRAEVSLPVRATPPYITALSSLTGQLTVEALDGQPFSVLRTHGRPPVFVGFDPAHDALRDRYTLTWDLAELARANAVPWFWIIETDRPGAAVVDVRVRHDSTRVPRVQGRPWVPKDQRLLVGMVRDGEPFEVESWIEYAAGSTPAPATATVASASPRLRAELIEARVDGLALRYRIRVTPAGMTPGLLYEPITLRASGFPTTVQIVGRVVE